MLNSAHSFKGHATFGWVADLLDNKIAVARAFAVNQGLTYSSSEDSIAKTVAIAAAVTPTDTSAALAKFDAEDSFSTTSPDSNSLAKYVDVTLAAYTVPPVGEGHVGWLQSGAQIRTSDAGADLLTFGMIYLDYRIPYSDISRVTKGPQLLLRWNGTGFDNAGSLVTGGMPNMYFSESVDSVGDMNGDGKPDVILGGNGQDLTGSKSEPSYVLLSNGAGYQVATLPNTARDPGTWNWAHGVASVKLADKPYKAAFVGDYIFGPSNLSILDASGQFTGLQSRLPKWLGTPSTDMNGYWADADMPVTAAVGADLDGDGADELIIGTTYSYHATSEALGFNKHGSFILKQDANGSFANENPRWLPDGPFAKRNCWDNATNSMGRNCYNLTVKQVAVADMNGDRRPDLVVQNHLYGMDLTGALRTASQTQILLNQGNLVFADKTTDYFGNDMASDMSVSGGFRHAYPVDLNGDRCMDLVLRGDANNSEKPRVFLNDCFGKMVDFSTELRALIPTAAAGIVVKLGGVPALILDETKHPNVMFHVIRFSRRIPTPVGGQIAW